MFLIISPSLSLSLSLSDTAARMDRHLRELDSPESVSNNIVHLYKPVGTEDEEPVQQRLATGGVPLIYMYPLCVCHEPLAHARSCCKSAATACTRVPALLPSCGVSVVCQMHAAG
jgi:hypothetical protein